MRVLRTRQTLHSWLVEAEVRGQDKTLHVIVKRPRDQPDATTRQLVQAEREVSERLTRLPGLEPDVRVASVLGVLGDNDALILEYAAGEALDKLLSASSEEATNLARTASGRLGEWLARFHDKQRKRSLVAQIGFPSQIRGYQTTDCSGFPIADSMRDLGFQAAPIEQFVKTLEKAKDSLPDRFLQPTGTYGDFGLSNFVVTSATETIIVDIPPRLCVDSPLRDLSSFLTSAVVIMARPSAMRSRIMGTATERVAGVASSFLQGYDPNWDPDWPALHCVELATLVSAWRDVRHRRGLRARSMRAWIEWKLARGLKELDNAR